MAGRDLPAGAAPFAFVADLDRPELDEADLHHLATVRRARAGDPILLGDGAGRWCPARFAGRHPEPTDEVQVLERPRPEVGVAFALVKGTKPELVVQKLTELGVDRIVPFRAARSVVRWDEHKAAAAHQRLAKVAREAAMQSRQAWIPTVDPVGSFAEVAALDGAALAERGGAAPSLHHPLVVVGPEGGWAPEELAAPVPRVALAAGVLRAETAAIVAGTLLVALRGGLVARAPGGSP